MSPDEREVSHGKLCETMVKKYGNIYFYKPYEHQLPVHSDPARAINLHGNNSGGKSYNAAAETCYEGIGFSPFRNIKQPPFGIKIIWIITTSYQIQLNSSQLLLFSDLNAPVKDIGLLPSLDSIQAAGGTIVWEKGEKHGILKSVTLPGGKCRIEFKSMESGAFSMAGAALDFAWVDEVCPSTVYNELLTRGLRKNGRLVMSYLVGGEQKAGKVPGEWVATDLYPKYEEQIQLEGTSPLSFYWFVAEDNESLDPEALKAVKAMNTDEWRFSIGGKFNISVKGTRVFDPYKEDTHMRDTLTEEYDDYNILYRAWDLGYARPACTAFQVDKYNRVRIFFSLLGKQEVLNDFIPKVNAQTTRLFPEATVFHELLPHDARRKYDTSPKSSEMIFRDNELLNYTVIYVKAEDAILAINKHFQRLIRGEPAILIDSEHAALTCNCCALYTRDENTGEPRKEKYYEHLADNMKMIGTFLKREGMLEDYGSIKPEVSSGASMYLDGRERVYGE